MGFLNVLNETTPNTPAAGVSAIFSDSNNNGRISCIHPSGHTDILSPIYGNNQLTNGGFDFIQRWPVALTTNTQTTPGNRYLMHDQWALVSQPTASIQVGRIDSYTTAITGSVTRYYAQLKQVVGAGKVMYVNFLEQRDTANLRGKIVRFQIKYATGAWGSGSALRLGCIQNNASATGDTIATTFISAFGANSADPTLGTNLAYVAPLTTGLDGDNLTGAAGGNALQITNPGASATFVRASGLFTVPTNCVNIGFAIWTDSQLSVNDVLNLAEAKVVIGQEINDYNPIAFEVELERAQRYYCKTFALDTAPAQAVGIGAGEWSFAATVAAAAANVSGRFLFPVRQMKTPGTVTFYNPASSNAFVRDVTHSADCTVTTAVNTSDTGVSLTCTPTAAGTVGGDLRVHLTADAGF
jgi:hypothetical protein